MLNLPLTFNEGLMAMVGWRDKARALVTLIGEEVRRLDSPSVLRVKQ
ncbi:MAG: hypothetical protein R3C68_16695 [Myxococcota bacterium]